MFRILRLKFPLIFSVMLTKNIWISKDVEVISRRIIVKYVWEDVCGMRHLKKIQRRRVSKDSKFLTRIVLECCCAHFTYHLRFRISISGTTSEKILLRINYIFVNNLCKSNNLIIGSLKFQKQYDILVELIFIGF